MSQANATCSLPVLRGIKWQHVCGLDALMMTNKKDVCVCLELEKRKERKKGRMEEIFIFGTQYKRQNFSVDPEFDTPTTEGDALPNYHPR